jgi:hypothetical protein
MDGFADHPDRPGVRIWRRPRGAAILSTAMALLCLGGAVAFVAVIPLVEPPQDRPAIALTVGILALFLLALAAYLRRDAIGKRGGTIILTATGIELDMPAHRSLAHRPPAFHGSFFWTGIASFDHRLEAYGAQGLGMVQRSYWLVPRTGAPLLLFEDRGIASSVATPSMMPLFREMARAGGMKVVERGMARGRGGLLGAWFARGPALDAPTMPAQAQTRLWFRVWLTGALGGLALLAMVLGALFR